MSNQPPLPPEIGNAATRPSAKSEYIEIEIPVDDQSTIVGQQSNNSCLYGCGGMFGCMIIIVGLFGGVLYLGVNQVFANFTNYFNLPPIYIDWGQPHEIEIPDNVYIPPVERVQALFELTTTRYNYAEVTTSQRDMPAWLSALYGDSLIMVVVGTIEAGIDVSQVTEEDIVYDEVNRTLTVTLPPPTLQSCFLDESQSYVVRRETAVFADPLDNLEDELRQRVLVYYRDTALEEGILQDAETEARASLSELLSVLVNDETVTINIVFEAQATEPVYPASCQ